jgi:MoxR-like ATPase
LFGSAIVESICFRITIGDTTHALPEPFLVLATQNPIEQEGTYPLPEAQVDRFMLKIKVSYPSREEEKTVMERMSLPEAPRARRVVSLDRIAQARRVVDEIYVDEKIKNYILDIVAATRRPEGTALAPLKNLIQFGASPRATLALHKAAQALAFLKGRGYVTPEDVKSIGPDVLRHRVILTYEAEAEEKTVEDVLQHIFNEVDVP